MINLVKCNKIHATKYGYILYEGHRTKKCRFQFASAVNMILVTVTDL